MQRTEQNCGEIAAELVPDAERELGAYARAVQELFGSGQVLQSVEDWMAELEAADLLAEGATPDWRCVTIGATKRLAPRVCHFGFENAAEFTTRICQAS